MLCEAVRSQDLDWPERSMEVEPSAKAWNWAGDASAGSGGGLVFWAHVICKFVDCGHVLTRYPREGFGLNL